MKFDTYTIFAKVTPAIISIVPLVVFHHFFINNEFLTFTKAIWELKLLSTLSISVVFTILIMEIVRLISKVLFEYLYFHGVNRLPTTQLLLQGNPKLTDNFKKLIVGKIKKDFKLILLNKREESKNLNHARKLISEAVSLVRVKMKGGRLIGQYNMQYGFIRNLIGGALLALPVSLFDVYFFSNVFISHTAVIISIICSIFYLLPLLLSFPLLNYYGYQYAECLLREYSSS